MVQNVVEEYSEPAASDAKQADAAGAEVSGQGGVLFGGPELSGQGHVELPVVPSTLQLAFATRYRLEEQLQRIAWEYDKKTGTGVSKLRFQSTRDILQVLEDAGIFSPDLNTLVNVIFRVANYYVHAGHDQPSEIEMRLLRDIAPKAIDELATITLGSPDN
ncbi:MAG TPA: hypothetical protein VHN99_04785 [Deinococcales bacterium]|nr:hypothetical protein [Deinococcales bacterium]